MTMNNPTIDHSARKHAQWAASATSRNVVCAGAIAMGTLCDERESEAAAWGTCVHQIAEGCLRGGGDASSCLNMPVRIGRFNFIVDEEMCDTAQIYIDYCRERWLESDIEYSGQSRRIEESLPLNALNPPIDAGGTADCIIWFPKRKLLEVIDLKAGRGVVVDVKGNPQGRTYALGALLRFPNMQPDKIMVTIVQPRIGDGRPKSETFHAADLMDWTVDLLAAMGRSKQALDEFNEIGGNRVKFDNWGEKWLKTGQCIFCPAKAICPKQRAQALAALPDIAKQWFEEPSGGAPKLNHPSIASTEEIAHWLNGFEVLEDWIKSVRAYAHAKAEQGESIPGWELVDKIGTRAWMQKDAETLVDFLQQKFNLSRERILEDPTPRSVAQFEKVLGKRKGELAELEGKIWHKPIKGTNLVSSDKTTRPTAKSTADRYHEKLEN
jgi:Protein of unknown function (DUF2800)